MHLRVSTRGHRYMKFSKLVTVIAVISLSAMTGITHAKVDETNAKRLKNDLTPVGAERFGNSEGTIPAWDGGIKEIPSDYKKGEFNPDPYANDKMLFEITKDNMKKYEKNLTEGQKALLSQYAPGYVLPVYPTHRSASYPDWIYEKLYSNALSAELQENGNGVSNTIATSPFPIPKNGVEAIWNHILRFRGEQSEFRMAFVTPTKDGSYTPVLTNYGYYMTYAEPGVTLEEIDNKIFYLKTKVISPAKLAGSLTLVHETLDQVQSPRKAWRYQAGERRLRRVPNLAYSTDLPTSESLRTVDQKDMYNGAPNQYLWDLQGKKEIYIPYNSYKLNLASTKAENIISPKHINQEQTRYELHRVWAVEGVLREGIKHIYHKRRFYFDEDTWQIVLTEDYDKDGKLWRVSEAHTMNYYQVPVTWNALEVTYDLKSQRYYADGVDKHTPRDFEPKFKRRAFTTSAARREAKR